MPNRRAVVGLDIGERELKVIVARSRRSGIELLDVQRMPLQATDGDARTREMARKLEQILLTGGWDKAPIAACVPMSACTLKRLVLPPTRKRDVLERMVQSEAENEIPLRLNQVAFDYVVQSRDNTATQVLIGACRREAVETLLAIAHAANAQLRVIVPSAVACWYAASRLWHATESVAIVDIGANNINVAVGQGEHIAIARSAPGGTNQLVNAIAQDLNCSPDDAEQQLRRDGVTGLLSEVDDAYSTGNGWRRSKHPAIARWVLRLEGEVMKTIQIFERDAGGANVQRIFLVGGGALLSGLTQLLTQRLKRTVELMDLSSAIAGVTSLINPDELMPLTAAFGAARALALHKPMLNFAPRKHQYIVLAPSIQRYIAYALGILNVVLLTATIFCNTQSKFFERQSKYLAQQLKNQRIAMQTIMHIPDVPSKVAAMRRVLEVAYEPHSDWLQLLYKLSIEWPTSAWVNEIYCLKGREVVIRGTARSYAAINEAVQALRKLTTDALDASDGASFFTDVVTSYTTTREVDNHIVVDFRLTCTLTSKEAKAK